MPRAKPSGEGEKNCLKKKKKKKKNLSKIDF